MAVSLMLNAPAGALGFVVIDPKGRTFPPAFTCAHLLRPVVTDTKEAVELLYSLLKLMELRDRNRENAPRVICVIDELADLVFTGGTTVTDPLTRLLQRGREAGIHIIAATQRPSAAILSGLMRANFPLRLVGKVVSPEDARIAAGCGGSGAERLTGLGDFIAVAGGQIRRFQAAYISTADTEAAVKQLQAGAAFVLPQGVPQGQGDISEDEIKTLTERLKPWWRQHGEEWGAKTGALRYLFGEDVPVGGSYWRMLEQALKHLGA
jgi:S-DNA-T family DNA segregation ATPase FtsK/SpoIIIE